MIGALGALRRMFLAPTPRLDVPPGPLYIRGAIERARRDVDRPYLHPTKGWRGHGTRDRGANRRRRRP